MATDPRDLLIYEAILEAFRTIDGTGDFHTDVSTAVAEGEYPADRLPRASPPCVAVWDPVTEQGDGPDLPGNLNRVTVRFQLWTPVSSDSASGRTRPRVRLAADLRTAIRAARASGSSSALYDVHNLTITTATADGRQLGLALSCGYGEGEIVCEYPVGYGEQE